MRGKSNIFVKGITSETFRHGIVYLLIVVMRHLFVCLGHAAPYQWHVSVAGIWAEKEQAGATPALPTSLLFNLKNKRT